MPDAPLASFTTSDGLRLAYDDRGSGPAVLCLAGLTRNMGDFEPLLPYADRCRLIRMDYRGRGASDWCRMKQQEFVGSPEANAFHVRRLT